MQDLETWLERVYQADGERKTLDALVRHALGGTKERGVPAITPALSRHQGRFTRCQLYRIPLFDRFSLLKITSCCQFQTIRH